MKVGQGICLLGMLLVPLLGGCVRGCYNSEEIVLTQTALGDPSAPEVPAAKLIADAKPESLACQTGDNPVRVDLYVDEAGIVQNLTFLDAWPYSCAAKYAQNMKGIKLVEMAQYRPLEHFRIELRTKRIPVKQCMRMQN